MLVLLRTQFSYLSTWLSTSRVGYELLRKQHEELGQGGRLLMCLPFLFSRCMDPDPECGVNCSFEASFVGIFAHDRAGVYILHFRLIVTGSLIVMGGGGID